MLCCEEYCSKLRVLDLHPADAESLVVIPSQINVLQAKKKFEILDAVRALCVFCGCSQ